MEVFLKMMGGVKILENRAYISAIIADIHFGAFDAKRMIFELQTQFLEKLEKLPILDSIIIAGDLYDHKLSLNSIHAKISIKFIERLVMIARDKSSKIRIIKGTESHDNKQLDLLSTIISMNDDVDARVIATVEEEMLFDDCKVLYIPEEYIDQSTYYKDYFNKKYDMIIGHGMFKELSFSKKQDGEINHPKAPIFNSTEISELCNGPVFFGHIHIRQNIKDNIFYVGSFSRWCYGEEDDKGFYICAHSRKGFKLEYVKNKNALAFDTVVLDFNNTKYDRSMESLFSFIDMKAIDNLRVIINLPSDFENPLAFTNMVNEYFSKVDGVKIVVNNSSKEKQSRDMEERLNELMGRYGFVFDKTMTHEEKISKFIKEKYKKNISVDRIRFYLYEQLIK